MCIDEIRRAVEATPRSELARVGEAVWKAWGQGLLRDDEAQALAERIEARRALPAPLDDHQTWPTPVAAVR